MISTTKYIKTHSKIPTNVGKNLHIYTKWNHNLPESAAKPQRNKNKRLYLQLIALLKTANVPEPFDNQLEETERVSCSRSELAVTQTEPWPKEVSCVDGGIVTLCITGVESAALSSRCSCITQIEWIWCFVMLASYLYP